MAEKEVEAYLNLVIRNMPATEKRLEEIRNMTTVDAELQELQKVILDGWPQSRQECKEVVRKYWNYRGEIAHVQGLLLKKHQIIIPVEMRKLILQAIHEGHLGMEKCLRRARQSVFWPGISNDVRVLVKKCEQCIKGQPSKSKEPMMVAELPTRAWQKVGSDLYEYGGGNYLIITDYYSLYPEVYKLRSQSARDVIVAVKDSFSRHGIPEVLFSDNGPCYIAHEFSKFANEWSFVHDTSSPRYPQSNGLAEVSVKSVKSLLRKCGGDIAQFQKGMLILRNSPLKDGKSPAQLLFGRQLRDNLPTLTSNLEQRQFVKRDMISERTKMKEYYDSRVPKQAVGGEKRLDFSKNQRVVIQHDTTKEWTVYGTVVGEVAPRSFLIKLDRGGELRRNSRFIKKVFGVNVCGQPRGELYTTEVEIDLSAADRNTYDESDDDSSTSTVPYVDSGSEDDNDSSTLTAGSSTEPYDDTDSSTLRASSSTEPYDEDTDINFDELSDDSLSTEEGSDSMNNRSPTPVGIVRTSRGREVKKKMPTDYADL